MQIVEREGKRYKVSNPHRVKGGESLEYTVTKPDGEKARVSVPGFIAKPYTGDPDKPEAIKDHGDEQNKLRRRYMEEDAPAKAAELAAGKKPEHRPAPKPPVK